MTYSQLSLDYQAQIQMAVRGGIKGPLEEWPTLRAALLELGHDFPPDTSVNHYGPIWEACRSYSFEFYRTGTFYESMTKQLGGRRDSDRSIMQGGRYGFTAERLPVKIRPAVTYMTDSSVTDLTEEKMGF